MVVKRSLPAWLLPLVLIVVLLGCQFPARPGGEPRGGASRTANDDRAATPVATAPPATAGDGVYTPVSNVDEELRVAVDAQDIMRLAAAVNEGRPLPADTIFAIYQNSRNLRGTGALRSLRSYARSDAPADTFPEAAQFFGSTTFLDDAVVDAVTATGSANGYTAVQQRAALEQSMLRILSYAALQQLRTARIRAEARATDPATGAPHNVDAAWAIYAGFPDQGSYPRSLAAVARRMETRFNREGTVDRPLREALQRAQRAAANGSSDQLVASQREVAGRFAAIFYLATAGLMDDAMRAAQAGDTSQAMLSQAEGLHTYMTIQPLVAQSDSAADLAVVRYLRADPAALSPTTRDTALNALSRALTALGLTDQDRLTRADFR